MPPAWKLEAPWREARPTTPRPKGPWWQRFGDAPLDALQRRGAGAKPDAGARERPPRAGARAWSRRPRRASGRSSASARARRAQRISANRPLTNYASPNFSTVQNDFVAALVGQLRARPRRPRPAHASRARRRSAEQSAADLENTRLLLGADLATAYFNLRAIDIELDVLARSIALQRRALDFVSTAPRPRRCLGPRRRAAAGAARHHADPGRRAAPPARRRSSTRSPP